MARGPGLLLAAAAPPPLRHAQRRPRQRIQLPLPPPLEPRLPLLQQPLDRLLGKAQPPSAHARRAGGGGEVAARPCSSQARASCRAGAPPLRRQLLAQRVADLLQLARRGDLGLQPRLDSGAAGGGRGV